MATETGGDGGRTASDKDNIDPEVLKKLGVLRAQVRESFGKVVMAMMGLPRYRHQSLMDLQHLVLDPLIRDRVAIAYPKEAEKAPLSDIAGLAIWASVSEEVDAKIRDQIKGGAWPIRLQADDWASGDINWLIDVIAPDQKTTVSVLGNFRQIVSEGNLRMHPIISRLVDTETLEKMGASRMSFKEKVVWGDYELPDISSGSIQRDVDAGIGRSRAFQHDPTKFAICEDTRVIQDRGKGPKELIVYRPGVPEQAARLVVDSADGGLFIATAEHVRANGIEHSHLSLEDRKAAQSDYLKNVGLKFVCTEYKPVDGFEEIEFSERNMNVISRLIIVILNEFYFDRHPVYPVELSFVRKELASEFDRTYQNPYLGTEQ